MGEKAVALISGGPDSATMAYSLKNEGKDITLLHLYQGKPYSKHELACARHIAEQLDVRLEVIDVSSIVHTMGHVLTIHSESAVLPYGTAIVASIATAYALQIKADKVYLALHQDDTAEGPEFGREFLDAMAHTVHVAKHSSTFSLETPFLTLSKPDIIRLGRDLGVPFAHTWSCIGVEDRHCGLCGACHARQRGFQLAGVPDPTTYAHTVAAKSVS